MRGYKTTSTTTAALALTAALLAAATACAHGPVGTTPVEGRAPGKEARAPFTLVATGDILPHDSVIAQAKLDAGGDGHDFRPMLAGVKPVISGADLAICHMETVYGPAGGPYTGYPSFVSPPELAAAARATGYDSCSTASNHTLDAGFPGVSRTLDALDAAGVAHTGSARTPAEARRPAMLEAGGATVAQLAYTYGTNGIPAPPDQPWAVNITDPERIVEDARRARRAGADIVVVSLHWGTEWQDAPDATQRRLARELTASRSAGAPDVDLILGTHAHVPQAYEKVNGTWVVYGMGDQIAGRMINHAGARDPRGNQGTIARFTFTPPARDSARWRVTKAEYLPQLMDHDGAGPPRVVDLDAEMADGEAPERYRSVRDRISDVVLSRGAGDDGLITPR
ncbi:CapA family protein [Streptomyces sp. WMMC500]|uniref:CapA family protein n=1 Tax=Streptomyces sp. WMMC500 TaxID=3015154 RepID=UPI00248CFF36|nr:CapA family protein [Streptomyces sp. WMMC500]WBB59677.1 CapA family protein [Streptomyces sp. WMMC500]